MNKYFIAVVVILILVGGGYYLMNVYNSGLLAPEGEGQGSDTMLMKIGDNAIYVAAQKPGSSIKATMVNLEEAGYVVVHEIVDGKPGKTVGSSDILPAGNHESVVVVLASSYEVGAKLIAMLHNDNGNSSFDIANDLATKDDAGNAVMMEFEINKDALENPEIAF